MLFSSDLPERRRQNRAIPCAAKPRYGALANPLSCLAVSISFAVLGCARLPDRDSTQSALAAMTTSAERSAGDGEAADTEEKRVCNPPAREIRFDGQERLLGGGACQAIPTDKLLSLIAELHDQQKFRSATTLVYLHTRSAQHLLLEGQKQQRDRETRVHRRYA